MIACCFFLQCLRDSMIGLATDYTYEFKWLNNGINETEVGLQNNSTTPLHDQI